MKISELLLSLQKLKDKNPDVEDVFVKDDDGSLSVITFCDVENFTEDDEVDAKKAIILLVDTPTYSC